MIIDRFSVFFDDEAVAASMTSRALGLMPYAGRGELFISLLIKGANTGAVSFAVTVQESENGAAFTDVGAYTVEKPDGAAVMRAIRLPAAAKLGKVRLSVAATGTVTGLTLFAGVTREHFAPYDEGLYLNAGKAIR